MSLVLLGSCQINLTTNTAAAACQHLSHGARLRIYSVEDFIDHSWGIKKPYHIFKPFTAPDVA